MEKFPNQFMEFRMFHNLTILEAFLYIELALF